MGNIITRNPISLVNGTVGSRALYIIRSFTAPMLAIAEVYVQLFQLILCLYKKTKHSYFFSMAEILKDGLLRSLAMPTSVPIALMGLCILLFYFYVRHFPKPIPGDIPYNKASARRLVGDMPEMRRYQSTGNYRQFFCDHNAKLKTSISQIFLFPYSKPFVLITDFREAHDILSKRHKEFDRSKRNADIFGAIGQDFHLAMQTRDPRFKGNKELVRDLMTPAFLNTVGFHLGGL